MISRFLYLTVGVALASAACAEESAPEVKTAGYHLKKPSVFHTAQTVRAPFWPIGWTPTAKTVATVDAPAQAFTLKPDQFSVTSILLGSQSLAVINGRTYGEGEFLRMSRAPKSADPAAPAAAASASSVPAGVKVRVNRITDGQVMLQAGTQTVVVALRRPTLSEKKSGDEDLLSQVGDR